MSYGGHDLMAKAAIMACKYEVSMHPDYPWWDHLWLAVDQDDFVGSFGTVSDAPVPVRILPVPPEEDMEAALLKLPRITGVMLDIEGFGAGFNTRAAERGIFSYDWVSVRPTKIVPMYQRISRPKEPLKSRELPDLIGKNARRIKLGVSFCRTEELDITAFEECIAGR